VNKCSAVAEMGDRLATIDMGRKLGAVPLLGGGTGSTCNTMRPGPRPTFVPSGILTVWPQQTWAEIGGYAPWGGAGSTSNTMLPGPWPTGAPWGVLSHPAVWAQQTWAENWRLGRKLEAVSPFWGGEAGSPSITMWPGPRHTSVPSGILIHAAVWSQ